MSCVCKNTECVCKVPHPQAALIKQWADGAQIQWYNRSDKCWQDIGSMIHTWSSYSPYRVKPEPKPDYVRYAVLSDHATIRQYPNDSLKIVYDGETGEPKSVELIK